MDDLINQAAAKYGLDPNALRAFIDIESSGNPRSVTGTKKGLFNIGKDEWAKYGKGRDIFDAAANIDAGAAMLADHAKAWEKSTGKPPSTSDLYLMHQQGQAGATAHVGNPEGKAWENVARFYPNERIAKSAIWGNVPEDRRAQFGDVENVTSGEFMNMWREKVGNRTGNAPASTAGNAPASTAGNAPASTAGNFDTELGNLENLFAEVRQRHQPAQSAGAAPAAVGGLPPGVNLAAMLPKQTPIAPPGGPGAGGINAVLANPAAANPMTGNFLNMMANGRSANNVLALLGGGRGQQQ